MRDKDMIKCKQCGEDSPDSQIDCDGICFKCWNKNRLLRDGLKQEE